MRNKLFALLLVLIFTITSINVLPVELDNSAPRIFEFENTIADGEAFVANHLSSTNDDIPGVNTLAVDGHTSSPLIDYIQNDCPEFSWNPVLESSDIQKDFQLEVWHDSLYTSTLLMQETHSNNGTFFSGASTGNTKPFGTNDEMRIQFKYPYPLVPQVGIIDKLYFEVSEESGVVILENLSISLLGVGSNTSLTSDFAVNYESREPIQVLSRESFSTSATNNWLEFDIENTFMLSTYTNLIIELRFSNNTGDLLSALHTTGAGGSIAYTVGAMDATTASITDTATHGLRVDISTDTVLEPRPIGPIIDTLDQHFPFGTEPGYQSRFQFKYSQPLIGHEGLIDKLYFNVDEYDAETTFENLSVYLLETPVDGMLNSTVMDENYGGLSPTPVLYAEFYTFRNLGHTLVLDVNNVFYYTNTEDLLIELRWDSKDSEDIVAHRLRWDGGGYRAYDCRYMSMDISGADNYANALDVGFIYNTNSVQYSSSFALVNGTEYYLRVKISDSNGTWSEWATKTFKYEALSSTPDWESLINDPDPAVVNSPVSVYINVTYFLGISSVLFEMDGTNYSMTGSGDLYTYTWTPTMIGNVNYTIFMESTIGTWSDVSSELSIKDPMLLLIYGTGVVILLALIVIFAKRSKK